jgi:hypothetical protein
MAQLQAVRAGPWKLYLPLPDKLTSLGTKTAPAPLELYDVRNDVGETREVSKEHPEVVAQLTAMAERARAELGDDAATGKGQRAAGTVSDPKPLLPTR